MDTNRASNVRKHRSVLSQLAFPMFSFSLAYTCCRSSLCPLFVLKYSRRFHIINTATTLDVWMRRVLGMDRVAQYGT